jgi:glycolate oxidase FAD binding subunit
MIALELAPAVVDFSAAVGKDGPVAVVGGRTRWSCGGPLEGLARLVPAPSGILGHYPEEMIVRVLAGTQVADLEDALGERGQRCALPERGGTVGGALAVGENHLDVAFRGTVRASLLQVRYVAHDGRVVTGGAPTVKNVSGFDLPRLLVGSLGTLGLLAEVVLRTNPVPAVSRWVTTEGADPFGIADRLLRRSTVLWDGRRTWVHLEGHGGDVEGRLAGLPGRWEPAEPPPLPPHRWSLRPSALRDADLFTRPGPLAEPDPDPGRGGGPGTGRGADAEAARPGGAGPVVASVGVGTVFAGWPRPAPAPDPAAARLAARAKALFDPSGRLNPGRDPARR